MNELTYNTQANAFKILLVSLLVFLGAALKAQMPNDHIRQAFQSDNPELMDGHVDADDLDFCYDMKKGTYNLLAISIKYKATNCLKYLVELGADVDADCGGKSPLMYTAKYGQLDMMKILVENGADLNLENEGKTALDYTKKYVKSDCEKFLLSQTEN